MTELLTYKQAATELNLTYRLIQKYVDEGRLGKKIPSGYLITRQDLTDFKSKPRPVGRPRKQPQQQ